LKKTDAVTVRDRDTMKQEKVEIKDLIAFIIDAIH